MRPYAIYRHGSNAANQSLCDKAAVDVIEAETRQAALNLAWERSNDNFYTIYYNQFLSAVAFSRLSGENQRDAQEAGETAARNHEFYAGEA
jgi:hypothetical protein